MYKLQRTQATSILCNESLQGETLEQKLERITQNKEPITDTTELTYTERKNGVQPEYNIRTDRFEIAIDGMDKVAKAHLAKRKSILEKKEPKQEPKTADGGTGDPSQ